MEATIPVVDRQLVVVVEGTAALGPHWNTIFFDYLEKIIRSFCGNEPPEQPQDSRPELGLVMFYAHGPYSEGDVQQTIWIKDTDKFLQMLKGLRFNGGGFSDSCVTEGLAEALLMFGVNSNGNHSQPRPDCHKHCILVSASNPYPLKTYIYKYIPQNTETRKNVSVPMEAYLSDAVMVAKRFSQFPYSLSIISARHLPKLQEVYNAGKHNPQAVDRPVTDKKNPYFLVLISDNFVEASNALSRPAVKLQPSQGIINVDGPSSSPNVSAISATMKNRHTVPVGHSPVDMVEVEPAVSGFCHPSPIMNATTQGGSSLPSSTPSPVRQEMNTNPESVQEFKPVINPISQTLRPVGPAAANMNILNNLSQHSHARQVINSASIGGGTSMGVKPMAIHMSNMISNGMVSSALSGMQSIPTSGALIETSQAAQNTAMGSLVTTNNSNMAGKSNISLPNLQQVNVGMGQSLPPNVGQASLNSASQFGQNAISINQSALNNSLSTSNISSGAGTMMPTPGMSQSTQSGLNYLDATNGSSMNMPSQQNAPGSQQPQSKYTKIWVGALSGQRQGQPVFICKLEGYRSTTASDKLADDWPEAMQIVRLISQDHMNNKQYVGKADLLVFRPLNPHGFLGQLHDKKLCAVIQLPSQTLLLSVIDRMTRLIGMLFPGDMVVFKPQASNQPQLQLPQQQQNQQQNQNQQQQQIQQQNQSQQNQQQQQRSQMIGVGLNQSFVQGPTITQLMSQQQGQGNMQGQGNIQGQGNMQGQGNIQGQGNMQGQGNLQAQGTMQGGNFLP